MAESVQRIMVPRALAGHHPRIAQGIIDWLAPQPDPVRMEWEAMTRQVRGGRPRLSFNCGLTHQSNKTRTVNLAWLTLSFRQEKG